MSHGPADDMARYQETGELKTSFLSISWIGPKTWTAKEIIPFAQRWKIVGLDELLASDPIDITELEKPNLFHTAIEEFKSLFGSP